MTCTCWPWASAELAGSGRGKEVVGAIGVAVLQMKKRVSSKFGDRMGQHAFSVTRIVGAAEARTLSYFGVRAGLMQRNRISTFADDERLGTETERLERSRSVSMGFWGTFEGLILCSVG